MVKRKDSEKTCSSSDHQPQEKERIPSSTRTTDEDASDDSSVFVPWWEAEDFTDSAAARREQGTLRRILEGSWQLMSVEAKEGYEAQLKKGRRQPSVNFQSQKPPDTTNKDKNNSGKACEPQVIGGSAPKLAVDNKGNRMLRSMGWNPGEGLGRNRSGRTSPIEVVSRPKLKGLGH